MNVRLFGITIYNSSFDISAKPAAYRTYGAWPLTITVVVSYYPTCEVL